MVLLGLGGSARAATPCEAPPDDVELLADGAARSLAERGCVDEALLAVRRLGWASRRAPAEDALLALLRARPELDGAAEVATLAADLAFWSGAWSDADDLLTAVIARWPDDAEAHRKRGIARLEQGDRAGALADFDVGCALGSAASCGHAEGARAAAARVWLSLEPSYVAAPDGADDLLTRLSVHVRAAEGLRLGLAGELRVRDADSGALRDTLVYALADWRAARFAAEAGVGVGVDTDFSPRLSAWVEPAVALAAPLWIALRYWRLSFPVGGAHVVAPAVRAYLGPVELELRYYLGLGDAVADVPSSGDTTHAVLVRMRAAATDTVTLEVGGGGGDAADYLDLRADAVASHGLALLGVAWQPSWRHRVALGYVYRREAAAAARRDRHTVTLGYRLTL